MKTDIASLIINVIWAAIAVFIIFALKRWGGFSFVWAALLGVPLAFGLGFGILWVLGKIDRRQ